MISKNIRKLDVFYGGLVCHTLKRFNYRTIRDWEDCDLVIVGYPKSGNTWLQNLVAGALVGIDTELLPDKLTQEIIPDLDFKIFYKRYLDQMFFCTHERPHRKFRKVIYLVRDPRDVMASYVAMVSGLGKSYTADDIVLNDNYLFFGTWRTHVRDWLNNPYASAILFVRYEDLKEDPLRELKRIMEFANIERKEEVLERSVQGNMIDKMKKKELEMGFDKAVVKRANWGDNAMFNRRGIVGSYKEELHPSLVDHIEKTSKNEMLAFSYDLGQKDV